MQNIHCNEFRRLLEAAVESRRPAEVALRDHAAGCEHCRPTWEEYILLEEALPVWSAATPEADLVDAVLSRAAYENSDEMTGVDHLQANAMIVANSLHAVRDPRHHGRARIRFTVAAMTLVSAAVVIAIVFVPQTPDGTTPNARLSRATLDVDVDTTLAPRTYQAPTVSLPSQASDGTELTLAVRDAGAAYMGLANGAADALAQGAVLLPPAAIKSGPNDLGNGIEPTWVDRVRSEVTPLGEKLGGAFDFLIEAFPTEPAPAT